MKSPHSETWKVKPGLVVMLILLLVGASAMLVAAAPPQPAGFYGYVTSSGANVPNGTIVSAWINGVQYATTPTFTDAGASVYTFDVPGDSATTRRRPARRATPAAPSAPTTRRTSPSACWARARRRIVRWPPAM
jgi:hypothetical protein